MYHKWLLNRSWCKGLLVAAIEWEFNQWKVERRTQICHSLMFDGHRSHVNVEVDDVHSTRSIGCISNGPSEDACRSDTVFPNYREYGRHLKRSYKLNREERSQYVPWARVREIFKHQPCLVGSCQWTEKVFETRCHLLKYLTQRPHNLSEKEAKRIVGYTANSDCDSGDEGGNRRTGLSYDCKGLKRTQHIR
jgi:hypothetical protein